MLGIDACSPQLGLPGHHGGKDLLVRLQMELHAPGALTEAEGLLRRERAGGERDRSARERERVSVPMEGDESFRSRCEERGLARLRREADAIGAALLCLPLSYPRPQRRAETLAPA